MYSIFIGLLTVYKRNLELRETICIQTIGVDFVDFDGPSVILKLHGRFWHQRPTVLNRVGKYIQGRIPEVVDVMVEDPYELTDEANNNAD